MPQGVIKKLVADRGFGFISAGRQDLFFHHSSVADNGFDGLQEGQTVDYEIEADDGSSRPSSKGPRATSVRPA